MARTSRRQAAYPVPRGGGRGGATARHRARGASPNRGEPHGGHRTRSGTRTVGRYYRETPSLMRYARREPVNLTVCGPADPEGCSMATERVVEVRVEVKVDAARCLLVLSRYLLALATLLLTLS